MLSVLIMLIPFFKSNISLSAENTEISLSDAIKESMNSMLSLCGTVIIFLVLISVANAMGLQKFLSFIGEKILLMSEPEILNTVINGMLEVTNGCISLGLLKIPLRLSSSIGAFLVTFGGICVLMQSRSLIDLKSTSYIFFKLIQGFIAAVLTYILTPFFYNETASVFNPVSAERFSENATSMGTVFAVSMLVIIAVFLLGIVFKNITNSKKR